MNQLQDAFPKVQPVPIPSSARPILFVVVDTEEEFDWDAPFSRSRTSVRHLRGIERVQRLFDRYEVRPTYVIDYPVASQPDGYEPIKELVDADRCTVGAHLHPWVTPPFTETVSGRNSFACNLGPALERTKIEALANMIGERVGVAPRVYKAGRYGVGRSTLTTLEAMGFDVDQSVLPHADFSADEGPSFKAFSATPFLFGEQRRLLELPCTSAYIGAAGRAAPAVHDFASRPALRRAHLVGIAARLRIADKLVLSPEGFTGLEMRRLTASLLRRGCRTFTLTFHSPSIEAGHTPYVRSTSELDQFLGCLDGYLEDFFGRLQGTTTTPEAFRTAALRGSPGTAAAARA